MRMHKGDLHHLRRAKDPDRPARPAQPAADNQLGGADLPASVGHRHRQRVVGQHRSAIGQTDLPAVRVAREHQVGLKRLDEQTARRMKNGLFLNEELSKIAGVRPLHVPAYVTTHSFHIYVLRFNAEEFGAPRDKVIAALTAEGVPCSSGYAQPLYKNPMFNEGNFTKDINYSQFEELCPNAEKACTSAIWMEQRLLLGNEDDMKDIVKAFLKVRDARSSLVG